jgi:Fuc2NAc and GlcNAc transferase
LIAGLAALVFLVALIGTKLIRKQALHSGRLDIPGARSSHSVATPRGGGAAIVMAFMLGLLALAGLGAIEGPVLAALLGGGLAIAAIGYADDRFTLAPGARIVVHFGAAIWALYCLGGLPPLTVGEQVITFGAGGYVLGAVAIVWALNLFNFMDGIDGIAASQAIFMTGAIVSLILITGAWHTREVAAPAILLTAACAGFLVWNWPPAKIFMGDVGSGFLGYVIAVLAVADARQNSVATFTWLLLGGIFFSDATVTLLRRLRRGERASEAHRSHAYQRLARRWQSHRRVTLLALLFNVVWLLPCAAVTVFYPRWAGIVLLAGLVPIVLVVILAGAGLPERDSGKWP